jgi:hypothetical protein
LLVAAICLAVAVTSRGRTPAQVAHDEILAA